VVRLKIGCNGQVKVSAPGIVSAEDAKLGQVKQGRAQPASDLGAAFEPLCAGDILLHF